MARVSNHEDEKLILRDARRRPSGCAGLLRMRAAAEPGLGDAIVSL